MTFEEATKRLEPALTLDAAGKFHFACGKALVSIKLLGDRTCHRFCAKDHVVFRPGPTALTIENLETGVMRNQFSWEQIESICAGEPETDSGSLFQG